jgi:hypothetical protein
MGKTFLIEGENGGRIIGEGRLTVGTDRFFPVSVALQKSCGTKHVPRGTKRVPNEFFQKNAKKPGI